MVPSVAFTTTTPSNNLMYYYFYSDAWWSVPGFLSLSLKDDWPLPPKNHHEVFRPDFKSCRNHWFRTICIPTDDIIDTGDEVRTSKKERLERAAIVFLEAIFCDTSSPVRFLMLL